MAGEAAGMKPFDKARVSVDRDVEKRGRQRVRRALAAAFDWPAQFRGRFIAEDRVDVLQMLPKKRVGSPEDLDALVVLLASSQSHFVNGAVIAADDGFAL